MKERPGHGTLRLALLTTFLLLGAFSACKKEYSPDALVVTYYYIPG